MTQARGAMEPDPEQPRGTRSTLLAINTLTIMSGAAIAPALPMLEAAYDESAASSFLSRLLLTAPALTIVVLSPAAGRLVQGRSRRGLLALAVALFTVAGTAGMWLDGLALLFTSRLVLGVAVAYIMTAATALAADHFDGEERAKFMAARSAVIAVGGLLFVVGGGLLADVYWRASFAIYGLAAFLIWPVLRSVPRHPPPSLITSSNDQRLPVNSTLLLVLACVYTAIFYLIPTYLPFLMHDTGIASALVVGLAIACATLASAVGSMAYPEMRKHLSPSLAFPLGFLCMGIGYALAGSALRPAEFCMAMAIAGAGVGVIQPHLFQSVLGSVGMEQRSLISARLTMCLFGGQCIAPWLGQPVCAWLGTNTVFDGAAVLLIGFGLLSYAGGRIRDSRSLV